MDTYKVAPDPLFKKINKHPIFQLAMLIMLVISGISAYRIYQNKVLQDRMAFFKNDRYNQVQIPKPAADNSNLESATSENTISNNNASSSKPLETVSSTDTTTEKLAPKSEQNQNEIAGRNTNGIKPTEVSATKVTDSNLKATESKNEANPRHPSSTQNTALKFKVHYIEASKRIEDYLKSLALRDSNLDETQERFIGLINNVTYSKLRLNGSTLLHQQNPTIENSSAQWFLGSIEPDTNSAIGISTSIINVIEVAESEYAGQISISTTLREGTEFSGEIIKKSIITGFQLKKNQVLFIGGFFPLIPLSPNTHEWLKGSLMKVLHSTKYQQNQTNVLIFFEISEDSQ